MALRIPEDHKKSFRRWLELPAARADAIAEALEGADPVLLASALADQIASEGDISLGFAVELAELFTSMARAASAMRSSGFIREVYQAAMGEESDAEGWEEIEARIERAISAPAVRTAAKAVQLASEHDKLYCAARILSDLRPVFGEDDLEPTAFISLHQLKISYHSDSEPRHHDVLIAMDREDLSDLRSVIDRAIAKHEALREVAEKTGLPFLEADS